MKHDEKSAARKLRKAGQFVHIDVHQGPQFADGDRLPKRVLDELKKRHKITVVQNDLLGEPMQFKARGRK